MKKIIVLGLLALLVVLSSLGSKCVKVTDPAADGPSEYANSKYAPPFNSSDFDSKNTCQAACNDFYTGLLTEENNRHSEAMQGFKGNSPEVKEQRKLEIERHKEEVRLIQEARQQCIRDCHDQGGAGGGF